MQIIFLVPQRSGAPKYSLKSKVFSSPAIPGAEQITLPGFQDQGEPKAPWYFCTSLSRPLYH
jgi:hypothetical protein